MDDDTIPLSALQHYLYCPRQCALIHIERLWAENVFTAEGRLLHERADSPLTQRRHGVRVVTAMPLADPELGIAGVADAVEFHRGEDDSERVYPVEYKRGRAKAHRADEVQLCAQALCLETMLKRPVCEGALFYGKTRRRKSVTFDEELRRLTVATVHAVQALIRAGQTPLAEYEPKRCDNCSLLEACRPRLLRRRRVDEWLQARLAEEQ